MVGAGGTQTCIHLHVSRLLYHCATDADTIHLLGEYRYLKSDISVSSIDYTSYIRGIALSLVVLPVALFQ